MHCSDTPRSSYCESNIIQNIQTNVYLVERINGQCHVILVEAVVISITVIILFFLFEINLAYLTYSKNA